MARWWLCVILVAASIGCAAGGPRVGTARGRCTTSPPDDHLQLFYVLCHNAP